MISPSQAVLDAFKPFLKIHIDMVKVIGTNMMPLPSFPFSLVQALIPIAIQRLSSLPNVLHLNGDVVIVGDLHGNLIDLIRILLNAGPPPNRKFLFLGDYVDRGEYSVEVVIFLLSLMIQYPNDVFLLRGNHELIAVNSNYGFKQQVLALYGNCGLFEGFNEVFDNLPIAAIVNQKTLCLHGGFSPNLQKLSQLEELDRAANPPCDVVDDILWSDPDPSIENITKSSRGHGYLFGAVFANFFLINNNLERLVRAHEYVQEGFKFEMNSKVITIFSSGNYQYQGSNHAAYLEFDSDGELIAVTLDIIKSISREEVVFEKTSFNNSRYKLLGNVSVSSFNALTPNARRNFISLSGKKKVAQSLTCFITGKAAYLRKGSILQGNPQKPQISFG